MEESNGGKGRRKKRLNLEVKEDRISDLPDCLLHHIISFLPSTAEAIRTGILSKRWQNQWTRTHVPILVFDSDSGMYSFDISNEDFARSIDTILFHHKYCSKIMKLHLGYNFKTDTKFSEKLRFAMSKHVEELILNGNDDVINEHYMLPKFLFDNASLVKLEMVYCDFMDDWSINWGSLKSFKIEGGKAVCIQKIANVLSGSPSLEFLELNPRGQVFEKYVIASTSLKTLILKEVNFNDRRGFNILCPNLEELSVKQFNKTPYHGGLCDKTIANVVSRCWFLRSLELETCCIIIRRLVIASTSLKKLVLRRIDTCLFLHNGRVSAIEISCPNLEELVCYGFHFETFKLMNAPSLICATLDFEIIPYVGFCKDMAKIFAQLQNVKELTMGNWFIEILSHVEMKGVSHLWSNNKTLTLNGANSEHLPGIICTIRSSPMLERLVIKLKVYEHRVTADFSDLNDSREQHYWNSDGTVVDCLLSHLKVVEIIGLSKQDAKCKFVVNLIKFILKNARVLEKLVLMISEKPATDFTFEVSKKVSSFPRCSQHAIVELLCSE